MKEHQKYKIAKSEAEELKRALDNINSRMRVRTNKKQFYVDLILHHEDIDAYSGTTLLGSTASPSLYRLYHEVGELGQYKSTICRKDKGREDIWILTGKVARDLIIQMDEEGIIKDTSFEVYMKKFYELEETYGDKELRPPQRKSRRLKLMKEINGFVKTRVDDDL